MARLSRKLVKLLPRSIRFEVFRSHLNLPSGQLGHVEFKIANTRSEFEQAFALLHDSYVAAGFMDPAKSGFRVTPHHLLPTTTTLIAKDGVRVVATVALVRDSLIGLPIDAIFNLRALRQNGDRLGEVSSLAIHPEFRFDKGMLLHAFIRYLWRYSLYFHGTNRFVIAVNPSMQELYESVYLFDPAVENFRVAKYRYVKGAPAVGLQTCLDDSMSRFQQIYGDRSDRQNLFRFMSAAPMPHEQYPEREFFTINDTVWDEELLSYFIPQVAPLVDEVTLSRIQMAYETRGYGSIAGRPLTIGYRRDQYRYDVNCPVRMPMNGELLGGRGAPGVSQMVASDVSLTGLKVRLDPKRLGRVDSSILAVVQTGPTTESSLKLKPVWKNESGYCGFRIERSDPAWGHFIHQIEQPTQTKRRAA